MKRNSPKQITELPPLDPTDGRSVSEQIYSRLYQAILQTDLPPRAKMSETAIADQMGVSRQPVREAFRRLEQMGLLLIRPQRATIVTPISESQMRQAQFIRCALEIQTTRAAAENITGPGLEELDHLISDQSEALKSGKQAQFLALDDFFHQRICQLSGHDYAWPVISEHKVHMDRIRYRNIEYNSNEALADHQSILQALRQGDPDAAEQHIRIHLGRILIVSAQIRELYGDPNDETAE